jgi:hypothetical protein
MDFLPERLVPALSRDVRLGLRMQIHEPMTMATDYLLALLAIWWGWKLVISGSRDRETVRKVWGGFLFATALAAITGGSYHGFSAHLSPLLLTILWKTTVMAIGLASFLVLVSIAQARFGGFTRKLVITIGAVKLLFYLAWMSAHDEFIWVILDYAPTMLFVLVVEAWQAAVRRQASSRWIVAGIVVSFLAAGIQASGFTLHRHFNHNDLYHVVQIGALYLLYRGGMQLRRRLA